nr:TetR/AcrR family transcriptional regulator [Methylomusa anaerophila]
MYYHFENKEGLFLHLAEQCFLEWWEQWEKISVQYESVADKLNAMGIFGYRHIAGSLRNNFNETV